MDNEKEALILSDIRSIKEDGRKRMEVLTDVRIEMGILGSKVERLGESKEDIAVLKMEIDKNSMDHKELKSMITANSKNLKTQDTKIWKIIVFAAAAGLLGEKLLSLFK